MAIGMAIGILVEALLPSGGTAGGRACKPLPKDEMGVKEWIRNKLKALSSLLGRLRVKAAKALPGILRVTVRWILNRAKEVVGWVVQNLWMLVITAAYTYMITEANS